MLSQAKNNSSIKSWDTPHTHTHAPAHYSETLAASKLTASFLCFLLEAEPGVWPVAGMFWRGGVHVTAVVAATASPGVGLDEVVLLLVACSWATLSF